MTRFRWLYSVVLITLAFAVAAQDAPGNALLEDAATYAAGYGVDVGEAVRRLELQRQIGDLDAALTAEEAGSFAGLWIQHQPAFRVVVQFTDRGAEERLKSRLATGPLADVVETRRVRFSLDDLQKRQESSGERARGAGIAFNSDINVLENRVELYVVEPEKLQARLAAAGARLPEGVLVKRVPQLAQSEALVGGTPLSTCTGGFTVRNNATGELGISAAAHCGNTQYAQGYLLPFRAEDNNTDQDVQWHSACDILEVTNEVNSGIGLRSIIGTMTRTNQTIGSMVCKYGMTTGRTCGTISSKTFDLGANHNATFIRVNNYPDGNLSEGGDSGGPWFLEDRAYGSHVGAPGDDPNDSIYMAINYISSIGVSVLTYNPGACNRAPYADFTWSAWGSDVSFDASWSSDPDGTIVQYDWDFGDGYYASTTSPYISHWYNTQMNYYVTLTVTDNEGGTSTATQMVNLCDSTKVICPY